jgi:hypothetical protein
VSLSTHEAYTFTVAEKRKEIHILTYSWPLPYSFLKFEALHYQERIKYSSWYKASSCLFFLGSMYSGDIGSFLICIQCLATDWKQGALHTLFQSMFVQCSRCLMPMTHVCMLNIGGYTLFQGHSWSMCLVEDQAWTLDWEVQGKQFSRPHLQNNQSKSRLEVYLKQ